MGLIDAIGESHEQANNQFVFEVGGKRHLSRKPHTRRLTSDEVIELRHFLMQAGASPQHPSEAVTPPDPPAPDLVIVVGYHGTKIFQTDVASDDAAKDVIRRYGPHHFLHHLGHAHHLPNGPAYLHGIAEAVEPGGRIVVVGRAAGGTGTAHYLAEYLRSHHPQIYKHVVS